MTGTRLSDAAAHERRQGLSWEWFAALFEVLLKPLAEAARHPESFYRGLRLLGVDGTSWSLRQSQWVADAAGSLHCSGSKRKPAGFFKWGAAVLVELGTHQPLAVACESLDPEKQEGEMTLARRVLSGIPKQQETLLLADRYYGRGAFLASVRQAATERCQMLFRVPSNQKAKVIEVLCDGSAIVEVHVRHRNSRRVKTTLRLREVRAKVWREGSAKASTTVRLWTTLLDAELYPAVELVALYSQRWEQELFFRELKAHTAREQLLRAGSPQGAEAEFGVMIIAASLLARQRLAAAQQVGLPPLRLSIGKIRIALASLLPVLQVGGDLLTQRQRVALIKRFMAHAALEARIPPRRSRSCQRGLRKPQCAWPRIRSRETSNASISYDILPVTFP